MNPDLLAAEGRCIAALREGRTPSAADERPLIEAVRRVTELPEERLLILARLRRERERRVAEASRAAAGKSAPESIAEQLGPPLFRPLPNTLNEGDA